jgi:hypothetical protein
VCPHFITSLKFASSLDQPMSHRGDRTFYGTLLATVIGFFCFSVYIGHSAENPLHDFESKPARKGSQGKSK